MTALDSAIAETMRRSTRAAMSNTSAFARFAVYVEILKRPDGSDEPEAARKLFDRREPTYLFRGCR